MVYSDKDTRSSPAQLAQMAMGFLFSASGAGVGIALVGKEGFQVYGIALFGICVVVALIFFFAERGRVKDEQQRHDKLEKLTDLYTSSFKDTGGLLVVKLEDRAKDLQDLLERLTKMDQKTSNMETMKKNIRNLRADILKILLDDLRGQVKSVSKREASPELISHYQNGLNEIIEQWQQLAVRSVSLAVGSPDNETKPVE